MVGTPSFHSRELRFHPRSHGMAKNLLNRFNQFGAVDHFCQRSFNLAKIWYLQCLIFIGPCVKQMCFTESFICFTELWSSEFLSYRVKRLLSRSLESDGGRTQSHQLIYTPANKTKFCLSSMFLVTGISECL